MLGTSWDLIWPTSACCRSLFFDCPQLRENMQTLQAISRCMYWLKAQVHLHMSMIVLVRDCSVKFSFVFGMLLCFKFLRLVRFPLGFLLRHLCAISRGVLISFTHVERNKSCTERNNTWQHLIIACLLVITIKPFWSPPFHFPPLGI